MSSNHSILLENDTIASLIETIAFESTLPSAFSRMIGPVPTGQSI